MRAFERDLSESITILKAFIFIDKHFTPSAQQAYYYKAHKVFHEKRNYYARGDTYLQNFVYLCLDTFLFLSP